MFSHMDIVFRKREFDIKSYKYKGFKHIELCLVESNVCQEVGERSMQFCLIQFGSENVDAFTQIIRNNGNIDALQW